MSIQKNVDRIVKEVLEKEKTSREYAEKLIDSIKPQSIINDIVSKLQK